MKTVIIYCDLTLEVTYSYDPGERETGPSYSCGGTPAIPPSVEIDEVFIAADPRIDITELVHTHPSLLSNIEQNVLIYHLEL
jgi:hypothetical protein